jgi:hypothetical protein
VDSVFDAFTRVEADVLSPYHLTPEFIKQTCRAEGCETYGERWIEIRFRVWNNYVRVEGQWIRRGLGMREHLDVAADHPRFSDNELNLLRHRFLEASIAFDQTLYRTGKRRTRRDNLIKSNTGVAHCRHNMPNYNFVIHQLLCRMGIRERSEAHFYFFLPRTTKVIRELESMWRVMCAKLGWRYIPREVIWDRDRTYSRDGEFVEERVLPDEMPPMPTPIAAPEPAAAAVDDDDGMVDALDSD